jgi:antitoxin VapB
MPTLNIKNERVYELARQLADATGASMTSVIEGALEEKLERMRRQQSATIDARMADLDAIVARTAPALRDLPDDPTAFLYDEETGLPR